MMVREMHDTCVPRDVVQSQCQVVGSLRDEGSLSGPAALQTFEPASRARLGT